jgi:hypothetical protein
VIWSIVRARPVVITVLLLSVSGLACADGISNGGIAGASPGARGFAMYALSRGKGVPEPARAALAEAEAMLRRLHNQGADITVSRERIGLEGETRLCVTFADGNLARETLERIRQLARGVDLVNVSEETCGAGVAPRSSAAPGGQHTGESR